MSEARITWIGGLQAPARLEGKGLDAVEPIRAAGHVDAALDEGSLALDLIGDDQGPLHDPRQQPQPQHIDHHQGAQRIQQRSHGARAAHGPVMLHREFVPATGVVDQHQQRFVVAMLPGFDQRCHAPTGPRRHQQRLRSRRDRPGEHGAGAHYVAVLHGELEAMPRGDAFGGSRLDLEVGRERERSQQAVEDASQQVRAQGHGQRPL
jgi:hypothetical protein